MRRTGSNTAYPKVHTVSVVAACSIIFGRDTLRGILRYANLQNNWQVYVDPWEATGRSLDEYPETDGAIYAGGGPAVYDTLLKKSRHMVCCDTAFMPSLTPIVSTDEIMVGEMAGEHLIECGYKHFGFYGATFGYPHTAGGKRLTGFQQVLGAAGMQCDICPLTWPSGAERMTRRHRDGLIDWIKPLPKPIGILCADDTLGFDLAAAAHETAFNVPDEIAIIGVNNDELLCEAASPQLSSVDIDFRRIGYEGAKLLDLMLQGKPLTPSMRRTEVRPLGVRQRVSTSHLAIEDKKLAAAVRYIRDHACDPCGVRDVLDHVPVARRWLERQFTDKVGRTPYEEIIRVRIDHAKRMLLQLDISVDEIASRCGYSATSNFNRSFSKATGTTPAAFRRESRSV